MFIRLLPQSRTWCNGAVHLLVCSFICRQSVTCNAYSCRWRELIASAIWSALTCWCEVQYSNIAPIKFDQKQKSHMKLWMSISPCWLHHYQMHVANLGKKIIVAYSPKMRILLCDIWIYVSVVWQQIWTPALLTRRKFWRHRLVAGRL